MQSGPKLIWISRSQQSTCRQSRPYPLRLTAWLCAVDGRSADRDQGQSTWCNRPNLPPANNHVRPPFLLFLELGAKARAPQACTTRHARNARPAPSGWPRSAGPETGEDHKMLTASCGLQLSRALEQRPSRQLLRWRPQPQPRKPRRPTDVTLTAARTAPTARTRAGDCAPCQRRARSSPVTIMFSPSGSRFNFGFGPQTA